MTLSKEFIFRVTGPFGGEFPSQRPVTRSFDVFFDQRLNKRLSKQSRRRWFETPACSLWRHRNTNNMQSPQSILVSGVAWKFTVNCGGLCCLAAFLFPCSWRLVCIYSFIVLWPCDLYNRAHSTTMSNHVTTIVSLRGLSGIIRCDFIRQDLIARVYMLH